MTDVVQLEPDLRLVTAPNAGPMTFTGTNTYILGQGDVAIIDPGPQIDAHFDALQAALGAAEHIAAILVTHSHMDHSPLARRLADASGAPIYAFGRHDAARDPIMNTLGDMGGGEGIDHDFEPDHLLADGQILSGNSWKVEAVHTPGHLSNHLSFATGERLFCGDHVMGWSTTLISPPDGDLAAFLKSIDKCLQRPERTYYSGHGKPILNPQKLMTNLKAHRLQREEQILQTLQSGPATVAEITAELYAEIDKMLHGAARRNVLAHLIDLFQRNLVTLKGDFSADARFTLA